MYPRTSCDPLKAPAPRLPPTHQIAAVVSQLDKGGAERRDALAQRCGECSACPRALRRAGRRRPIAHDRRGVVPGSLPFQGGRCGLRPRREGRNTPAAAHPRLSTHQVPLSRLSHAHTVLAGSPRDISIPQAKSARSQRITPPPAQGRLPSPSAQPSAPVSRSERLW